jgi:hypothetical protein
MVIIEPDWVSRVMCQVMAYCTSEEPKRETVWLPMKRDMSRFQFGDKRFSVPGGIAIHAGFYNRKI